MQRAQPDNSISGFQYVQQLLKNMWRPSGTMPPPILTFEGGAAAQFCACAPPDTDGDVGPNHYVEAINTAFAVYNKTGTLLVGPVTYNTFFASLVGTPCQNQNRGDPVVLYDHVADRWVITDFAFASFPGTNFYECIGVSQSPDPVAAALVSLCPASGCVEPRRLPEDGAVEQSAARRRLSYHV